MTAGQAHSRRLRALFRGARQGIRRYTRSGITIQKDFGARARDPPNVPRLACQIDLGSRACAGFRLPLSPPMSFSFPFSFGSLFLAQALLSRCPAKPQMLILPAKSPHPRRNPDYFTPISSFMLFAFFHIGGLKGGSSCF